MEYDLKARILENLNSQETDTLVEIWRLHNLDEWQPEVFELLEEILLERLGELPKLDDSVYQKEILTRAKESLASSNLVKALKECEEAILQAPEIASGYYLHAKILQKMDCDEAALVEIYKTTRLDPYTNKYWQEVENMEWLVDELFEESETRKLLDAARDYFLDGDFENSIEAMNRAENIMPVFAPAWNYRGMIFEGMQLLESAIGCYLHAVYLNPRFWNARENLGNARKKLIEEMHRRQPESIIDEETGEIIILPNFEENRIFGDLGFEEALPSWFYLDECAYVIQGTPGYRLRPGFSGYDPLDRNAEVGRMEGILIKKLLTGKLRTHNPLYLLLLLSGTLVGFLPYFQFFQTKVEIQQIIYYVFITSPYLVFGSACIYNLIASFVTNKSDEEEQNGSEFY